MICPDLQRDEAVLHALVAPRQVGEPAADLLLRLGPLAPRPQAEDRLHVVGDRAAHAAGVRLRVVDLLGGELAVVGVRRVDVVVERRVPRRAVARLLVTVDRRHPARRAADRPAPRPRSSATSSPQSMTSDAVVHRSVNVQLGWSPSSSPGYIASSISWYEPPEQPSADRVADRGRSARRCAP